MHPDAMLALMAALAAEGPLALAEDRLTGGPAPRAPQKGGAVQVIPIVGAIAPRSRESWFGSVAGMDSVRDRLRRAAAAPDVASIVLDIDSPGGTVAGTAETAAAVAEAAAIKPVIAVANTLAASAAYWIGSRASEFVASPSAEVGSIGVIGRHVDMSRLEERLGIKTTLVKAGKYKGEMSPFAPLTPDALAALQASADDAYGAFVADVAAGRRVSERRVREGFGEGRVLGAKAALAEGMIDRIATLDEVVAGASAGQGKAFRRRSALAFL